MKYRLCLTMSAFKCLSSLCIDMLEEHAIVLNVLPHLPKCTNDKFPSAVMLPCLVSLHFTVIFSQCSSVHYSSVQNCYAQYCYVQYCSLQYCSVQYCSLELCSVQYCSLQYCSVQYCFVQYWVCTLTRGGEYREIPANPAEARCCFTNSSVTD